MDFSTNVKRFGSQLVTSSESCNPTEFGLESFVVYFTSRGSVTDPLKFQMRVISMIEDDSKHDTHTATINLDRVLQRLTSSDEFGRIDRVILISDGSAKEYKSAHAFAIKKELAQKYDVAIFHFYCTDDGKGLVDSLVHMFS